MQLNAITSPIFAGIGRSPVPVLLPFDTARYLEARRGRRADSLSLSRYQADFRPADLFHAGPAGYDAVFSLEPGAGDGMPPRTFAKPVEVQITGSILIYDLADPARRQGRAGQGAGGAISRTCAASSAKAMCATPSPASACPMWCRSSAWTASPRARRLACREAYPVAERFLKALRIAGGQPARPRCDIPSDIAERPAAFSPDFTYRPSGDIIARSGSRKRAATPTSPPIRKSAFRWRKPRPSSARNRSASARSGERSGAYPWRDNFCEARSFEVGQCAAGFGHQGQDIRPAPCPPNGESGSRCDPKQQAVVAVRDGILIRSPKQQAATLQINTRNEHIRFRYMHMNPSSMDADGILNGRRVAEGEKIGVVSNYLDHPNGTSYHLHFDVQVFTRDGWIWVNPYTTLISAYERLIRGRGREIGTDPPAAAAVAHALPEDVLRRSVQQGGEN